MKYTVLVQKNKRDNNDVLFYVVVPETNIPKEGMPIYVIGLINYDAVAIFPVHSRHTEDDAHKNAMALCDYLNRIEEAKRVVREVIKL